MKAREMCKTTEMTAMTKSNLKSKSKTKRALGTTTASRTRGRLHNRYDTRAADDACLQGKLPIEQSFKCKIFINQKYYTQSPEFTEVLQRM